MPTLFEIPNSLQSEIIRMNAIRKIVITGGPCGGKTTVLNALKKDFNDRAVFVPEVATMLLSGGFPAPEKDLFLSEKWHRF